MQNDNSKLKIIFLGQGLFGEIILKNLLKTKYQVIRIESLKNIKEIKPDLIIVASCGEIIPKEILKIPKYGSLNVHPSLLPKYRGPSPIQTSILNGDKETGVTIMLMDEKIDQGPIIAQEKYQIKKNMTYQDLEKILANQGANLLIKILPQWIRGKIKPQEQDHSQASYTKILKRQNGQIDWSESAQKIERKIRAFYPWPGTFFFWKNKRIKILQAEIYKNKLLIKKLQPEGKKPMTAEEFKKGHHEFNPLF